VVYPSANISFLCLSARQFVYSVSQSVFLSLSESVCVSPSIRQSVNQPYSVSHLVTYILINKGTRIYIILNIKEHENYVLFFVLLDLLGLDSALLNSVERKMDVIKIGML